MGMNTSDRGELVTKESDEVELGMSNGDEGRVVVGTEVCSGVGIEVRTGVRI